MSNHKAAPANKHLIRLLAIVLAIPVRFPFTSRYWALPVLCALYRPEELNQQEGRRHKTACHLARQLMAALIHWFPKRNSYSWGMADMPRTSWPGFVTATVSMQLW